MTHSSTGAEGRRRGGPRSWLRPLAVVLLVPGVTACPPKCEVQELEIVPSTVTVGSDPGTATTFELEARLWKGPPSDRVSISVAESPECKLTWKATESWLSLDQTGEDRARVTIDPGASPSSPGFVKVTAGDAMTSAPGAEIRVEPATVTDQDMVLDKYVAGRAPSAVLVNGTRNDLSEATGPWLTAFVRREAEGQVDVSAEDPSWAAAVLDAGQRMAMYPGPWTSSHDQMGPPPGSSAPVLSIPVALRIAVDASMDAAEIKATVMTDIAAANSILSENRVGVRLEPRDVVTVPSDPWIPFADCPGGDALPSDDEPGVLHLWIVPDLGNLNGLTCPGTKDDPRPVIYIAWQAYTSSTIVHEVGHALGLDLPYKGHAEDSPGLDASNVMSGIGWDTDPFGRHRFTVGQAFRMNADSASWLNWAIEETDGALVRDPGAPRLACQCGAEDPAGRCPRLADDVARPRGGLGDAHAWDCHDRLKLPPGATTANPAGLLAGRSWRDPGNCSVGVPASPGVEGWFLQLDNLTRPGGCPSWAAIFLTDHAPIFQKLVERLGVSWTSSADLWVLDPPDLAPGPRRSVTVGVYYPASEASQADLQMKEAKQVFGNQNRSGIDLALVPHTGSCSPADGEDFSICYQAGGPVVAQLVGKAFGLPLLTAEQQDDPAFAGNVMQPTSSLRGQRLTLGQLFLIHSTLKTEGFPGCPSTTCPPLNADVSP